MQRDGREEGDFLTAILDAVEESRGEYRRNDNDPHHQAKQTPQLALEGGNLARYVHVHRVFWGAQLPPTPS